MNHLDPGQADSTQSGIERVDGDWLLDLGNTRLKIARVEAARIGNAGIFPLAAPGFSRRLQMHFADVPEGVPRGHRAWLASSTSHAHGERIVALLADVGLEVIRVQTQAQCRRLRIAYAEPSRMGVDRFLALLAASEHSRDHCLVVSIGSALTVDLLAADGGHVGGLIALSPILHREALSARIPHLDVTGGTAVDFADDTADAMASGAQAAALGLIERSLRQAERRLGAVPSLVLTGGGGETLLPLLPANVQWQPALVLDGLALYARIFGSSTP